MALKINSSRLLKLLEDFYVLSGVRIVIFDDSFRELLSYPTQPVEFCALLKENTAARRRCEDCDRRAFEDCRRTGQLQIYQCHAGLIDAAAPIRDGSETLGYVMFGQVISEQDKEKAFLSVRERLMSVEPCPERLSEAFGKLRYRSDRQLRAASSLMEACACYLWLSELVSVKNTRLAESVDEYIDAHLCEGFTIRQLCSELGLKRSRLYELSAHRWGMGAAGYIKKRRLSEAKRLMKQTDLSFSQIAERVGLADYNYFYKLFKKETGVSPRQFREAGMK